MGRLRAAGWGEFLFDVFFIRGAAVGRGFLGVVEFTTDFRIFLGCSGGEMHCEMYASRKLTSRCVSKLPFIVAGLERLRACDVAVISDHDDYSVGFD